MKIRRLSLSAATLAALIAAPAFAQDAPTELSIPDRAANPDAVADEYRLAVESTSDDLKANGRGQNLQPLISILKNGKAFERIRPVPGSGLSSEAAEELMILEAAQLLAINGIRPNQLNNLKKKNYDPATGAERIFSGRITLGDAFAFSSHPVRGRLTNIEKSPNGLLVSIDIVEAYGKFNKMKDGTSFEVALHYPLLGTEPSGECIFFLSQDRHSFRKAARYGFTGGETSEVFFPYCDMGGSFQATHSTYADQSVSYADIQKAASIIEK